ncbi:MULTISPECIES: response regulator transcription factor [unclassified Streptomyces]|uniref:response regulator n=1 Tax=unclassified Streptomyces TaxID=2593676 RepID=UPI002258E404|nr:MULTISPECIES: response regulator transcription factor [unclassified Streptomyces]MCX5335991.1 response regulator transcription factor [Streptomyces sp. NBC_00140]MCX5366710.1 response regulator transcription factor [Streptomyces sp. NBC_00124]
MTTVLIVDDHSLQRFGLRMLLEQHPDLTVVGEAAHGAEAVRKAAELRPDVVLMDVRMPGMDGIEATRRIVESGGRSHVLVLTTFDIDEHAYDVLCAGARGFLLKDALPDALIAGIRAVAAGDLVIAPGLTRELIDDCPDRLPGRAPDPKRQLAFLPRGRHESLTQREREVLTAIASGWSNLEIGERLSLAESTVKTHVSHILAKIGARDRVQAVIFAYDAGLVRPARTAPPRAVGADRRGPDALPAAG